MSENAFSPRQLYIRTGWLKHRNAGPVLLLFYCPVDVVVAQSLREGGHGRE